MVAIVEPHERDEVIQRLDRIEARLAEMDSRLLRLERPREAEPQAQPTPPPIVASVYLDRSPLSTPARPVATLRGHVGTAPPPRASTPPPPPPSEADTEYKIGAQILPKAGAFIVVIGLAYLVSLAVGRGLITPAMLWWGANLLGLGFIGFGQWKRDEKEQFGSILTAIGSCALYLNFAAGNVFQHLYEGETLVGLFVALSLVNVGYAFWRSTKVFLALGLVGGLIAALMPLDKQAVLLNVVLTFLILIPCTLISARNAWKEASAAIWAVGTASLLPIAINWRTPDTLRVGAILGVGLLTVAGYASCYRRKEETDWHPYEITAALLINALLAFLCLRNPVGAAWMTGYGVAIAATAFVLIKEKSARSAMTLAATLCVFSIAPFGFWQSPSWTNVGSTIWILCLVAAASGLVSSRWQPKELSLLGFFETTLAIGVYGIVVQENLPLGTESGILVSLMAILIINAWALVRAHGTAERFTMSAALLCAPMVTRLVQVTLVGSAVHGSIWQGIAVGASIAAALSIGLSGVTRWKSASALAVGALAVSFTAYWVTLADLPFGMLPDVAFSLTYIGMVLAAAVVLTRSNWGPSQTIQSLASGMGGLLVVRLGYLFLTMPSVGWHPHPAAALAFALVALAGAVVAWRKDLRGVSEMSAAFTIVAGTWYILILAGDQITWAANLLCCLALTVTVFFVALANWSRSKDHRNLLIFSGAALWATTTQLGYLLLSTSSIGMKYNAAISTSWVLFAAATLCIGFVLKLRDLRLMSFAVVAATVGKVFLVDLSALDSGLRVAVLLFLGLAMIGGGYWYIRTQRPESAEPQP